MISMVEAKSAQFLKRMILGYSTVHEKKVVWNSSISLNLCDINKNHVLLTLIEQG